MKKYQIILADPPWSYYNNKPPCKVVKQPKTCGVNYYYKTMKLSDIKGLPIKNLCEDDCVLFLWATTPNIQEAFEVMKSWGFKYKTMITWEKTNNDCMGYWFRVCTEHLLVGIRGKIKSFRSMVRTCYHSPRGKHSEKPKYFKDLINGLFPNKKKIELFARQKTEGWTSIGYDIDGMDIKESLDKLIAQLDISKRSWKCRLPLII
jgi:N6-adenosine-specific RNA methylase IME4